MDPLAFNSKESSFDFEQNFQRKMIEFDEQHKGSQKKPWTRERIFDVINQIKQAKVTMECGVRRKSMDYYWMSKYDVLTEGDEEHLIFKRKPKEDPLSPTIHIIPREAYFGVLKEAHESCGHGGRDKVLQHIKTRYYIPKKPIEIFISLCPTCEMKRNLPKKNSDYMIRGQVELIDFQSCPDGDYKWLLIYQDIGTKFLTLRPLTSNKENEVAVKLLKIFLTLGAPYVLQCDYGLVFTVNVIKELIEMWPDCKIFQGSAETQVEVVEPNKQDVEYKLRLRMSDNKSTNWSLGCYFVQYQKNTTVHHLTGKTPFKSLFGSDAKAGLSGMPSSILKKIETEEGLKNLPEYRFNENVSGDLSNSNITTDNDSQTDNLNPQMIICKTEVVTEDDMPGESSTSTHNVEIDYLKDIKIEKDAQINGNEAQGIKRPADTAADITAKRPASAISDPVEFCAPKLEPPEN